MSLHIDGLAQFLDVLPAVVRERLEKSGDLESIIEVVLDYGRPAEARYRDHVERWPEVIVSESDIEFVSKRLGEFGTDNRAGIERTLHRISAIRNRHSKIIGLTCRVGRALEGTIDVIDDIVRSGQSILLLGRPGVGKTTKLREIARVLADEANKRVVIVDTSNEIAGDGDVPHPGIGSARRMQVRIASEQHAVMIEAVENHMPEVIVIDEIGNEAEAQAARTIAERGVQLVGTAHGQTLENLMLNPSLADLIGGIQAVTLSDAEAQRRGTQKTVLERKSPPTFDVVVELLDYDRLAVHNNVQKTVDMILRGVPPRPEIRVRTGAGDVEVVQEERTAELTDPGFNQRFPSLARNGGKESVPNGSPGRNSPTVSPPPQRPAPAEEVTDEQTKLIRIFPYGIARTRLERAIREKRAPAYVTNDISQADAVMAIRSTYQAKPKKLRDLAGRPVNTVVVKSNTFSQIAAALDDILQGGGAVSDENGKAAEEAQMGIELVLQSGKPYELSPASGPVRKMQHQMAEARRLASESVGEDPHRRLRILPTRL
ncbi:R3H domain-containing nucleic acid-binding protein [Fimbriimonas ginsengisoli]|uniref:Single-stranded nucleic acid binding R3H n=1 Tax=Fimbriimonas ginsengisoli Gsoil 348 TaxID=661478 RepID=A0A068NLB5_FIMGI|nr:R3H domain-containing nucleic acid-binding protein [Fimbriimonas ginsengisoli]AIE84271.1 single-stranded nucleic acid binding R3H [Fimbriimonas ginsengisoli Gsoil 348]